MGDTYKHDWVPSTLGHGNMMCRKCFATDLEAAAIGIFDECPRGEPTKGANDNAKQDC